MAIISAVSFYAIGAIAKIIGSGTETAGAKSAAKTVRLHYSPNEGLEVRMTDGLLGLRILLPAKGDETAWTASVNSTRLSELARCLGSRAWPVLPPGSLVSVKSMSAVTIQPVSERCLAVERDDFLGRIGTVSRQEGLDGVKAEESGVACEVPFGNLAAAVDFLRSGQSRGADDDPLRICTFFPDGVAFSTKRLAYLAAASPALPFPISLRNKQVRKMATLFRYARKMAGLNDDDSLVLTRTTVGAGHEIQISSQNGNVQLRLRCVERQFLREAIEQGCQRPPVLIARVDRESLAFNANLLGPSAHCRRLALKLEPLQNGLATLKIAQDGIEDRELSSNQFECFMSEIDRSGSTLPVMRTSARAILEAVAQFSVPQVSMVFRPPFRIIEMHDADIDLERRHKVFLPVEPLR